MGDDNLSDAEHARPRKRTRRACDKCSTSRTRCDGDYPCRRCNEYGYSCHYDRTVKKRGRQRSDGHPVDDGPTSEPGQTTIPKPAADDSPYRAYPSPRDRLSIPFISEDSPSSFRPINLTPPAATSPLLAKVQSPRQYSGPYPTDKEPWAGEAATPQTTTPSEGSHGHRLSVNSNNNGRSGMFAYSQPRHELNTGSGYTTDECKYKFLHPLLPYIRGILTPAVACELLDVFLTDPGNSLFCGASPYILTRIFRKKSVLHPIAPRKTTPALLATILWCVAQTADVMVLQVPGARNKIVSELYGVATALVAERDPDRWRRTHVGLSTEREMAHPTQFGGPTEAPATTAGNEPTGTLDDVLTFTLLSIAVSGGDFKSDCYKWWSKAIRLMTALRLNRHDEQCTSAEMPCTSPICHCHWGLPERTLQEIEKAEERRRVFWLLYSLDRHLSLSFNTTLTIVDSICQVYVPLPNLVWENLDMISPTNLPRREYGPPVTATGTEFFEYFLPLMTLLGDIIEIHHRWRHPRLGASFDAGSVAQIDGTLETYRRSLDSLTVGNMSGRSSYALASTTSDITAIAPTDETTLGLVKAYGIHIYHVLYVLLRGKWDFLSMLDGDGWLSSEYFSECSSHTIMASQSVSAILNLDPELAFMSYLFGIYLLQGSFVLLLFADRMPLVGINESVEQACETIIRAHEVCVVTLSTEFQKAFRKVVRSTLNSVRGQGSINKEEYAARLRALSLYRWTKGGRGLAL